jgi:hypothetical protein
MYVYCILTWRVSLVERELLTIPENLNSPPVFNFMCLFCRSLFVLLHFFLWPLSSIYGFWLLLWYLQILLFISENRMDNAETYLNGGYQWWHPFQGFFFFFFFFRYSWYPPNIQLINYVEDFFYECHGGCNFTVCCKEIYLNCKI